jgi:hypothetical protein
VIHFAAPTQVTVSGILDEVWWRILLDVVVAAAGLLGVIVPFVLYFIERRDRKAAEGALTKLRQDAAVASLASQARRFHVWAEDPYPEHRDAMRLRMFNGSDAPIFGANASMYIGIVGAAGEGGGYFNVEAEVVVPTGSGPIHYVDILDDAEVQRVIAASLPDRQVFLSVSEYGFYDAAQRSWLRDGNSSLILRLGHGETSIIDQG